MFIEIISNKLSNMGEISNRNMRLLDKLVGQSIKSEPHQELNRIMKLYFDELIHINDRFLFSNFRKILENKIYFVIKQDFRFYDLEKYINKYPELLDDYLEDITDSIEDDFIEFCISEQNSILDNTIKFLLEIENYDSINVLKFVSENFLDEYKSTSKRKIDFLQTKLKECNLTSKSELNPYSFLFVSRQVYDNFIKYTSSYIIDFYIDYSYLKKRLEVESLIHKTTDKEFMRLIYEELKLISENRYRFFVVENKLRSLKKSYSTQRENNFNIVFGIKLDRGKIVP